MDAMKCAGDSGKIAVHIATRLSREVLDHPSSPDPEKCIDLLKDMANLTVSVELLERTQIGKLLVKTIKAFKRHKRTAATKEESTTWEVTLTMAAEILENWKSTAGKEEKSKIVRIPIDSNRSGLPRTVVGYRTRLVTQKKELYKDPPVLPPMNIVIDPNKCAPPKRDKTTGALTFGCGEDTSIGSLLKEFHPNRTPEGKR
jgi:hypothetical protein